MSAWSRRTLRGLLCVGAPLAICLVSACLAADGSGKTGAEAVLKDLARLERKTKEDEAAKEAAIEKAAKGIDKLQWWDACAKWGRETRRGNSSPAAMALNRFLKKDGAINDADENAVYGRATVPVMGMSACGVMALLGLPDRNNVTTNSSMTHVQMVYAIRRMYVYAEGSSGQHNGIVTSVQY